MRVMMIVKATKDSEAGVLPTQKMLEDMGRFNDKLIKSNIMLTGEGLKASKEGFRVRHSKGKTTVTDGPFAETKELVAGFWILKVKSMDEAVDIAKRVPFQEGEVEIRPFFELEDIPVDPKEDPEGWRKKEKEYRAAPQPARKPGTKRWMGLLKADNLTEAGVMPKEEHFAAMGAFFEEGLKSGVILSGDGLQPSSKSKRVRYSGEKRTVIDGPFAETKELVAGFAMMQFASRQEAVDWSKRFVEVDAPARENNTAVCEVRPVFEIEDFPVSKEEKPGGWRDQEKKLRDEGR